MQNECIHVTFRKMIMKKLFFQINHIITFISSILTYGERIMKKNNENGRKKMLLFLNRFFNFPCDQVPLISNPATLIVALSRQIIE